MPRLPAPAPEASQMLAGPGPGFSRAPRSFWCRWSLGLSGPLFSDFQEKVQLLMENPRWVESRPRSFSEKEGLPSLDHWRAFVLGDKRSLCSLKDVRR